MNYTRAITVLAAASVCIAGQIGVAAACNYDGAAGASAKHPRAIEVATALRDKSNAQILDARLVAPTFANMLGYHRAVRRLQRLRESLERAVHDRADDRAWLFAAAGGSGPLEPVCARWRRCQHRRAHGRPAAGGRRRPHRRSRHRGDRVGTAGAGRGLPPRLDRRRWHGALQAATSRLCCAPRSPSWRMSCNRQPGVSSSRPPLHSDRICS